MPLYEQVSQESGTCHHVTVQNQADAVNIKKKLGLQNQHYHIHSQEDIPPGGKATYGSFVVEYTENKEEREHVSVPTVQTGFPATPFVSSP
jgi:hypothetical protein